ncbi:DUF981 family protein [Lactobacillus sp. CC-MHH1034]|uniref:DUF981 family protein n=1 Tax=Agrilactobacillus fermenti TaxID=2586909 RepID=UPI001E3E366A|nr:DUF981 family protein [Agrilactobacillus fermenti]MCD2255181.1 DUF981 family protein [Agrilactobacillus fermenti]
MMIIPWERTAMYNTLMAVATGVALILLVWFSQIYKKRLIHNLDGWIAAFALLDVILALTGLHMTLTWPLAKVGFPFDNIIFGEPSTAFGFILLAFTYLLIRLRHNLEKQTSQKNEQAVLTDFNDSLKPLSIFITAMGLALVAIAIAGMVYQLFAAPPQEPISGMFATHPHSNHKQYQRNNQTIPNNFS